MEQPDQGLLQDNPERGAKPPGLGVDEIIPQKLEGPGRIAARLQNRGMGAGVGLDGRGLAVVGEDPGLAPKSEDKGVGVALVHLAAGFVADVGQDDGAVHHPGQPLEGDVEPAVGEHLVAGFLHHRDALPEKPDAPAMHVLAPPDREQRQRGGGSVMLRG